MLIGNVYNFTLLDLCEISNSKLVRFTFLWLIPDTFYIYFPKDICGLPYNLQTKVKTAIDSFDRCCQLLSDNGTEKTDVYETSND